MRSRRAALSAIVAVCVLISVYAQSSRSIKDKISQLPGTTFKTSFNQYAGYLKSDIGSSNYDLHYWFIESQINATADPLLLFINGGPGCSSVFGLFEEIGPFRVNSDSQTLFENVFAWNKVNNLLVIDAPATGFSFGDDNQYQSDSFVVSAILNALVDFYTIYPNLVKNELYIAGEGYASFFATPLAYKLLINSIPFESRFSSPIKFRGLLLANGVLSSQHNYNSMFPYMLTHGFGSIRDYDDLKSVCCKNNRTINCDFYNADGNCKTKANDVITKWIKNMGNTMNLYQDCYRSKILLQTSAIVNYNSTDPFVGYPCTAEIATENYLNREDVKNAFHVSSSFNRKYESCRAIKYGQHSTDLLGQIVLVLTDANYAKNKGKIMIYNGDLDPLNNFIGAQLFGQQIADALNLNTTEDRIWRHNYDSAAFKWMDGGVITSYTNNLHIASIRGGGHYAPQTRPSQSLQLFRDFVLDLFYNNCLSRVNKVAAPLLPEYQKVVDNEKRKNADKIASLPGLTYEINFNQYSGYLKASETHKFFYWFVESQQNPNRDPVLLWLNGGPGSSSVWGMLTENGPFRPNKDGQTLYENIHSWNRFANVLYIESPHQVGFSYSTTPNDYIYGDDLTAENNYNALKDFFTNIFPEYKQNEFYITGESYGGVYVPTLSRLLITRISLGDIILNFKGIAIGNAELTTKLQVNSVIFQLYTYGLVGETEYNELVAKCCPSNIDPTECDFYTPYIYFDYLGNYHPVEGADEFCSKTILGIAQDMVWTSLNNPYNIYQDCYTTPNPGTSSSSSSDFNAAVGFQDEGQLINLDSSDPFDGFPCWNTDAATIYLNRADVRTALHVPEFVQQWQSFNQTVNEQLYNRSYFELDNVLADIIKSYYYTNNNMKILIYNGDTDMVCNHLGDQWFIEQFAKNISLNTVVPRNTWNYALPGTEYVPQLAGYIKTFEKNLNLMTVKGSGHLVPQDRPGPALQMIFNFIHNLNMNNSYPYNIDPKPLLPAYTNLDDCEPAVYPNAKPLPTLPPLPPLPPGVTYPSLDSERRSKRSIDEPKVFLNTNPDQPTKLNDIAKKDMILSLPGLTWNVTYRMFSGYLTPPEKPLNHLFYWFIESQSDPVNDPVVLWLNGGPGCSSLGGFFTELGPFHPNDDNGQTLYENVYSWNKKANVIFLEAPVEVGFSYTEDNNYIWNDDTTAEMNAFAIKLFFKQNFPQYAHNEFFITGESYGGVYCPTLTLQLIEMITAKLLDLNIKGMAVGNGILSEYLQTNSEIVLQYGRGMNGIDDWNSLKSDCNITGNPIYFDFQGVPNGTACYDAVNWIQDKFYNDEEYGDLYNLYQDCYTYDYNEFDEKYNFGANSRRQLALIKLRNRKRTSVNAVKFRDTPSRSWYYSTDPFRGLNCYGGDALVTYLSREDVQTAIHAKKKIRWTDCVDRKLTPQWKYKTQEIYYDMSDTINAIMNSKLYTSNNMRLMFYNGDVDTICQFLGDQWLIEMLVAKRNLTTIAQRQPWIYQKSSSFAPTIAGYIKSWSQNLVQLTVKGSGHFVPSDRPAQALQMLTNFLTNQTNYSTPANIDTKPSPLFPTYSSSTNCTRAQADRIVSLPGLPVDMKFRQYSGFLDGNKNHKIHYWLVESENDPTHDPLLLWLNGGPGSSSLMGLFEENGPYRVSKDGTSLSRNPYAWNKFANILYLESPTGVGYSYSTDGVAVEYNDNATAYENYNALKSFFKLYPQYQTSDFYTTGESYGGVYVPTLAKLIVLGLKSGDIVVNYKGMAIGNGVIDKNTDFDSQLHFQYYHGGIDKTTYTTALNLCCPTGDEFHCKFSSRFTNMNNSIPWGNLSDPCYDFIVSVGANLLLKAFDPYNVYQQCWTLSYNDTTPRTPYGEDWTGINYDSTDPYNGYPCYMDQAMETYLNQNGVRKALNIPDSVGRWYGMNAIINAYTQQVDTDTDIFKTIIDNAPADFNILLYNGDVDAMVNWFGAEIYTSDAFTNKLKFQIATDRSPWYYQLSKDYYTTHAGFQTRYTNGKMNIDVLTVKGSGHLVPLDRPQQALQMIYNFIKRQSYSIPYDISQNTTTTTTQATTPASGSTGGSTLFPGTATTQKDKRKTFLWSIRHPKSSSSGFLFGTIHVPYTEVWNEVSDRVREAFSLSDTVLLEVNLQDEATVRRLIRCKNLKRRQTAKSYLPPSLYNRIERLMLLFRKVLQSWAQRQNTHNEDAFKRANEVYTSIADGWERKRPEWLLFLLYQMCENVLERSSSPMLDLFLAQKAISEKKMIRAIETTEEQCNPIESVSDDDIIFSISYTVGYLESIYARDRIFQTKKSRSISELVKHYKCGTLEEKIFDATEISRTESHANLEDRKRAEKIDQKLKNDIIIRRNARMAKRLDSLITNFKDKTIFSAIGTGHFFGNHSVLNHLKAQGYIITEISNEDIMYVQKFQFPKIEKFLKLDSIPYGLEKPSWMIIPWLLS
ncbi:unnamed protein product [Caenorhabditis bovis]|uniref:Carboxypeptidase n=1 Tax=Caenorhabditis bovis TaxID=2654633 RepID=A0A8S1EK37_9PELO|nr:unnamed protein product [Caenorhabditis bovis]